MKAWHKVVSLRDEVREGRSFDPSEFAIDLSQVVNPTGKAPDEYRKPDEFFARTVFTKALQEHMRLVLRRLAGETTNTAPVLALLTQFGGGKTHTLTALYHVVKNAHEVSGIDEIRSILRDAAIKDIPRARIGVFVGSAWDPHPGSEKPWIDIARQLAGDAGVEALGESARTTAPGTDALLRLFDAAGGSVLLLLDEVLNYLSRNRQGDSPAEFRNFVTNLVRAMTQTTNCAAVISLPQSKPEMDDWEQQWQELLAKEVGRVAKQLIANDESEIGEVVRRRLFKDLGSERERKQVAKAYADWCFESRDRLPSDWVSVDTATSDANARERLQQKFLATYPFHPATMSVFQRKWRSLAQYQQTRGTLAMLAHWVSIAYRRDHEKALNSPLIMLGAAPLDDSGFRSVVLGQLGEQRLDAAIGADIAGDNSHAKVLDDDAKSDELKYLHRHTATAMFFESTGGQAQLVARIPELRFAVGGPGLQTTSIDNAADALERHAFYIRKLDDGFRVQRKATLRKVWNDHRAALDPDRDVWPRIEKLVTEVFNRGSSLPIVFFPSESADIPDRPRLTLAVLSPRVAWQDDKRTRDNVIEWSLRRGDSPRTFRGSIVWCVRKPGNDLPNRVTEWLAWQTVQRDVSGKMLQDLDQDEARNVASQLKLAEDEAREEVWSSYRYVVISDEKLKSKVRLIDLGAGHASSGVTLSGRVIDVLKSEGVLSASVGASYLRRNWPPVHEDSGAWPLVGLRQSLIDGSLIRLIEPDETLREKIPEFVRSGDFGLASGRQSDGTFMIVRFEEEISRDEVTFDNETFLITKERATELTTSEPPETPSDQPTQPPVQEKPGTPPPVDPPAGESERVQIKVTGAIPSNAWNKFGTTVLPKLRQQAGDVDELTVRVEVSAKVGSERKAELTRQITQALSDLGLTDSLGIE